MNKKIQHKMPLPAASPAEDLETISRNKLNLLFDSKLFEVRPELIRDKGIDIFIELKQNNSYTNFRFAVQLKSTATAERKNNSTSYPVDVANINYLLNYGMPSFYILYDHPDDIFYFEQSHTVFQELVKKYSPDKLPKTFSIKFSKILTQEAIQEIYEATLVNGMLLRRLNSHINLSSKIEGKSTGIVIDEDNEVYSVEQNMKFIEEYGFHLMNHYEFRKIVEIEQRTYPQTDASPTFNMVCGMAYFQQANLFRAIEFLKKAELAEAFFEPSVRSLLTYTLLQARHMLGMIKETQFKKGITELMEAEKLGSYLAIEKIHTAFINSNEPDKIRIEKLQKDISALILEEPENFNLRIRGYSIILQIEGRLLLHNFPINFVMICGRVPNLLLTKTYGRWKEIDHSHTNRLRSLMKFCMDTQNFLCVSNIAMDLSDWEFEKFFITNALINWDSNAGKVKNRLSGKELDALVKQVSYIDNVIDGYRFLNHQENIVYALKLKYEILRLAGKLEAAEKVTDEILGTIKSYDFNSLLPGLQALINGDLRQTKFIKRFTEHMTKISTVARNNLIKKYFMTNITKEGLEMIERNIKWTDIKFMDLDFPTLSQTKQPTK